MTATIDKVEADRIAVRNVKTEYTKYIATLGNKALTAKYDPVTIAMNTLGSDIDALYAAITAAIAAIPSGDLMGLSRRDLLVGTAALLALSPATARPIHGTVGAPPPPSGISKRNVRNINGGDAYDYRFIDHFKMQDSWGPVGTAFSSGTLWNSDILDVNGYPNIHLSGLSQAFGGGIRIRSSSNYSGNYVFDGPGQGRIHFPSTGTYTVNVGLSSNVTVNGNGDWSLTGSPFRVVFTYTGPRQLLSYYIDSSDPSSTGAYMRSFRFFRSIDEIRLNTGALYCIDFLNNLVAEDPSALRSLDMNGVNGTFFCRWPQRTPIGYASYRGENWNVSPPYGDAANTANAFVAAVASGTPVFMTHGEIACIRMPANGLLRASGAVAIQSISKANPGVVQANGHGYNTGDRVISPDIAGMTELKYVPCTITVTDANHYTIGINTTSFGTFTSGNVVAYADLQVGSGLDRTAYPIMWCSGSQPIGIFGSGYLQGLTYVTFVFDKTISGKANTSGVYSMGAWLCRPAGNSNSPPALGAPPASVGLLMNELNALSPTKVIDLWYPMPSNGLNSMDPNYTAPESYPIGVVGQLLNGDGATFPGLTSTIKLFLENSNEDWNGGFTQTSLYAWRGFFRWPASGITDFSSFSTLRSQVMVADLQAAFPGSLTRMKFVRAGQGTLGYSGTNVVRIDGNTNTLTDVLNPSHLAPMTIHDLFAFASYFQPSSTATLAALAASWISNLGNTAAQNANCQSFVNLIVGVAGLNQETIAHYSTDLVPQYVTAVYTAYAKQVCEYEGGWDQDVPTGILTGVVTNGSPNVTGVQNNVTVPNGSYVVGLGISDGLTTLVTSSAGVAGSFTLSTNSTYTGTVAFEYYDASSIFLRAVKRNAVWATAYIAWFNLTNSNAALGMFADFTMVDHRWGHFSEDAYDTQFVSSTAYANPDPAWNSLVTRNASVT